MVGIFLWIMTAYGMSNIIVNGSIFDGVREYIISKSSFFGDLISCMMCTSFWVGIFMYILFSREVLHYFSFELIDYLFVGCFTSGTTWVINSISEYFITNSK